LVRREGEKMKVLLSLLLLVSISFGDIYDVLARSNKYSYEQKLTIAKAYRYGEPYDLGYTMAAICIIESRAGDCMVNLKDPSFGPYHNLLSSVMRRKGLRNTPANQNMIAHKLMTDFKFASEMALQELLWWQNIYRDKPGSWSKMVMSYNAGCHYENGKNYLKKIRKIIKELKD
jgi:hypothetical protein